MARDVETLPPDRAAIRREYEERRRRVAHIARHYGVGERTIRRWAREEGWRRRYRVRPPSAAGPGRRAENVLARLCRAVERLTAALKDTAAHAHTRQNQEARPDPHANDTALAGVSADALRAELERRLHQQLAAEGAPGVPGEPER